MTRFRPCIDLHSGQVKQIVGGTLSAEAGDLKTNHISILPASHFAKLYRDNALTGTHVIMLGPGNEEAGREALSVWPGSLQIGGGITQHNARQWIEWGAEKVIVTSYLFPDAKLSVERLEGLLSTLSRNRDKLVIDLSCRRQGEKWIVAMNKWQTLTDMELGKGTKPLGKRSNRFRLTHSESIAKLEPYCSEFLIHAADNEGLQRGIDEKLVESLAEWCSLPVTYAGGGKSLDDLDRVKKLSGGRVDLTLGSALDIFGGGVKFEDCVRWNAH